MLSATLILLRTKLIGERRSSFHEAGHVLAAMRWTGGLVSATVVASGTGKGGHVHVKAERVAIEGLIAFIMAGYAGERARGYPEHNDVKVARRLRTANYPAAVICDSDLDDDLVIAVRQLRDHRPDVPGIAGALAGYQRARAFMQSHRAVLFDVADALYARKTLEAVELYAVVGARLPDLHQHRP
jgi:hypothetical protein